MASQCGCKRVKSKAQILALTAGIFCLGAGILLLVRPLMRDVKPPDLRIRAVAHQWWWEFEYPELKIKTSNILYLPSSREVRVELASADVIHSFWILGMKNSINMPPGKIQAVDLLMKSTGELYGNCNSGCGCGTTCMHFRVVVRAPEQFGRWAAEQRAHATEFHPPLQKITAPACATDPSRDHRAVSNTANSHLQRLLDGG